MLRVNLKIQQGESSELMSALSTAALGDGHNKVVHTALAMFIATRCDVYHRTCPIPACTQLYGSQVYTFYPEVIAASLAVTPSFRFQVGVNGLARGIHNCLTHKYTSLLNCHAANLSRGNRFECIFVPHKHAFNVKPSTLK